MEKTWLQEHLLEAPFSEAALEAVLEGLGYSPLCFAIFEDEASDPQGLWERLKIEQPLLDAARAGDIGGIRSAMANGARDLDGALAWAVSGDQALAAAYLLDAGADMHAFEPPPGCLIKDAIFRGKFEAARLLLERGAPLPGPEIATWPIARLERPVAILRFFAEQGTPPEKLVPLAPDTFEGLEFQREQGALVPQLTLWWTWLRERLRPVREWWRGERDFV